MYERARRSPALNQQRSNRPLPGPDFATAKRESRPFHPDFCAAKRQSRPFHPDFSTAKRQSRPFHPDFFTAKRRSGKADLFTRTSPRRSGEARKPTFSPGFGRRGRGLGAKTARFRITREGSKFYETATKGDVFVATSSPLVNLLFFPRRAKLWLRRGKTPPPKPRRPARRPQRP